MEFQYEYAKLIIAAIVVVLIVRLIDRLLGIAAG